MNYQPKYPRFIFEDFGVDGEGHAYFNYAYENGPSFREEIDFGMPLPLEPSAPLAAALLYCFVALGTSYYKLWPAPEAAIDYPLSQEQAHFFTDLYHQGLGEFLYVNDLEPSVIASFAAQGQTPPVGDYQGEGVLLMQSGGKDSLLAADLLTGFTAWHLTASGSVPEVVSSLEPLQVVRRTLDLAAIQAAKAAGALEGHVPFSAILAGLATVSAILGGQRYIVASNEWSANEPTAELPDGTPVNHQYSKSWAFEQAFQAYLHANVAEGLDYGSVLRPLSELKINQLFVERLWPRYGHRFSSCNRSNYRQGSDNSHLGWCGDCPKCANAWLLLVPFVERAELIEIFGRDLYQNENLREDFKQLLGLSETKPFECVGEIAELQLAYHQGRRRDPAAVIDDLEVPASDFNPDQLHDHQPWLDQMVDYANLLGNKRD